jgi:hypothetical protein
VFVAAYTMARTKLETVVESFEYDLRRSSIPDSCQWRWQQLLDAGCLLIVLGLHAESNRICRVHKSERRSLWERLLRRKLMRRAVATGSKKPLPALRPAGRRNRLPHLKHPAFHEISRAEGPFQSGQEAYRTCSGGRIANPPDPEGTPANLPRIVASRKQHWHWPAL